MLLLSAGAKQAFLLSGSQLRQVKRRRGACQNPGISCGRVLRKTVSAVWSWERREAEGGEEGKEQEEVKAGLDGAVDEVIVPVIEAVVEQETVKH